jgi:hypothetical protein
MSYINLNKPFYNKNITPKNKKYSVYVVNPNTGRPNIIHFGARAYQHYKDSTEEKKWSNLDHNDPERRRLYRARHRAILKDGKPAYLHHMRAEFWSWHYLW